MAIVKILLLGGSAGWAVIRWLGKERPRMLHRDRIQEFNRKLAQSVAQLKTMNKKLPRQLGEGLSASKGLENLAASLEADFKGVSTSKLQQELLDEIKHLQRKVGDIEKVKNNLPGSLKGKERSQILVPYKSTLNEISKTRDRVIEYNRKLEGHRQAAVNLEWQRDKIERTILADKQFVKNINEKLKRFEQNQLELKQKWEQFKPELEQNEETLDPIIRNGLKTFTENSEKFLEYKKDINNQLDLHGNALALVEDKLTRLNSRGDPLTSALAGLEKIGPNELSELENKCEELLSL